MDERRTLRVGEAIRVELTEIIGFEMEDPRLREVDVTEVQVSPDSRHATVKIAVPVYLNIQGVLKADPVTVVTAIRSHGWNRCLCCDRSD